MTYAIDPPRQPSVAVSGADARFPVRRIFCVGRNYADHVREMGADPKNEPPLFFTKPADAVVESGAAIPYPPDTANLHHEVELVVAIGAGGADIAAANALDHIWGYAVGVDLTRRDRQAEAKKAGGPWDAAKAFDNSAPIGALVPRADAGPLTHARIWLSVNGETRQDANLDQMIWSIPEIIAALSRSWALAPGDLIFTGTPAGVGPLVVGDVVACGVAGLPELRFSVTGAMALEDAKAYGSVGVAYSGGPSAPRPATQPVAAPASDGKRQYSEPVEAELTLPETIDGIVASKSRTGIEIQVGAGTSEAFFRLLLWLPYGYALGFYDQYQNNSGGEDDPGVFVSITRKGASFVYMAGNHGWSSDWVFQCPEVLAAWMALNLKPAGARPSPLKTIDVRRLWTPPFKWW